MATKYSVRVQMSITKDGARAPMSDTDQEYRDLDYADVCAIQQAVVGSLLELAEENVKVKGASVVPDQIQI